MFTPFYQPPCCDVASISMSFIPYVPCLSKSMSEKVIDIVRKLYFHYIHYHFISSKYASPFLHFILLRSSIALLDSSDTFTHVRHGYVTGQNQQSNPENRPIPKHNKAQQRKQSAFLLGNNIHSISVNIDSSILHFWMWFYSAILMHDSFSLLYKADQTWSHNIIMGLSLRRSVALKN